jgi:hypothetical protein
MPYHLATAPFLYFHTSQTQKTHQPVLLVVGRYLGRVENRSTNSTTHTRKHAPVAKTAATSQRIQVQAIVHNKSLPNTRKQFQCKIQMQQTLNSATDHLALRLVFRFNFWAFRLILQLILLHAFRQQPIGSCIRRRRRRPETRSL